MSCFRDQRNFFKNIQLGQQHQRKLLVENNENSGIRSQMKYLFDYISVSLTPIRHMYTHILYELPHIIQPSNQRTVEVCLTHNHFELT